MEFGPVTFPAYEGATAGVRSLTDDFIQRCIERDPEKLRSMLEQAATIEAPQDPAPSEDDAEPESHPVQEDRAEPESHLADERRELEVAHTGSRKPIYGTRRKETSKPWLLEPSKSTKQS